MKPVSASASKSRRAGLRSAALRRVQLIRDAAQAAHAGWNQFWYSPADPAALCLIRVLAGGMLLYTHVVWGLNLPALIGSQGWNSPDVMAVVQEGRLVPSFWWCVPDQWFYPVHYVCLSVLFLFWIGFATRVTSVLSMIITVSYSYRAHMANFGLDQINAILCLYLCIGPSGALLSVDRLIALWRGKRRADRDHTDYVIPAAVPSITANLAIRLTQMHFCVIYAYAGLSKLQGGAWWNGEAVWMAFANLEYQSVDMTWVAWYPWISDVFTHGTIVWEVFFPAMVWVPVLRPSVLFIGFLLHVGIGGMMGLWTFGLIMIFGHISFWPSGAVRSLVSRLPFSDLLLGPAPFIPRTLSTGRTTVQPAVLWVDQAVRRRLMCLRYFWQRGFRCLSSHNLTEAQAVRQTVHPDAVVLMGTDMPDQEVAVFHEDHWSRPNPEPLFMILTQAQSERLNGRIHTPGSHILTGSVSLGRLRREIQEALEVSR